ncbi:nucleoside-diphosphate sugar epimerase/dehydratase, partial [Massilibacteroides sp.]|uniref:UDP-N-acetylglucosamine 4,6-dehydratase family protein n=1 Tax=Massilibacteroides sp. TaxID=2034766 RepID=UPI002628F785
KGVIRHSSFSETGRIGLAAIVKVLLLIGSAFFFFDYPFSKFLRISFVLDVLITFFILVTLRMVMISVYTHLLKSIGAVKNNLLIFTNDPHNNMFLNSPVPDVIGEYRMAGFLQIGSESSYRIGGYPSYFVANSADFGLLVAKHLVKAVLFMDDHAVKEEDGRLLRYCEKYKIKMLILPKVNVFNKETLKNKELQEVRVEDLLSRDEIEINMSMIKYELEGKVVMVTGAAGSIGSEICRQLCSFPLKHLLLFDCAETPTHNLRLELLEKFPGLSFSSVLGDVRNKERVEAIIERYRPGVIFHAAAYKHVPLMEENPCEAICTNVYGTRMVADAAVAYGVEKFVMISTDKAVNPTNVMGASKRLAEMYVQSLNSALQRKELKGVTRFVTTRFGNVLGSNGSVIPLFRQQIAKGGPLTVTHPDIIRYFMTIPEACRLVLEAGAMGKGGEIFVFDMGEPVKIADLAYRMITLAGLEPNVDIKIVFTGLRPGEKLYEELLSNEEETLPTPHEKIRVASVRQYEYVRIAGEVEKLTTLAFTSEIMPTVRRMKELIPEFISKNSVFEELDKSLF